MATINLRDLANLVTIYSICKDRDIDEMDKCHRSISTMIATLRGSRGIINSILFNLENSSPDMLLFSVFICWPGEQNMIEHTVKIRPSFTEGFLLTISGRNRNEVKTYLVDIFHEIFYVPEFPTC